MVQDFILGLQDLRYLDWTDKKLSLGTPGCFLKAYEEKDGIRYYYKMSNYDSYRGVFGHECINEIIVSRLLDILEIEHLQYQLIHARILVGGQETESYICKSANFRKRNEKKIAFDTYYELNRREKESPLDFALRNGWGDYVYQMFAVDYLICNRDRHGANIEILLGTNDRPRLVPLFDNGLSLLFSCYGNLDSVKKYDVLEEKAVNNFIGSKSLEYNLKFIPKDRRIFEGELKENDREYLFKELNGLLPSEHFDKIWEMIWERWRRYVQVCD